MTATPNATAQVCTSTPVINPNVVAKPANLDFDQAAGFTLSFLTAWSMLHKAAVRPGECVLVQGGASGVGSAAIQIAKLLGAGVIATAGSTSESRAAGSAPSRIDRSKARRSSTSPG